MLRCVNIFIKTKSFYLNYRILEIILYVLTMIRYEKNLLKMFKV